jgi:hypothetical protein
LILVLLSIIEQVPKLLGSSVAGISTNKIYVGADDWIGETGSVDMTPTLKSMP